MTLALLVTAVTGAWAQLTLDINGTSATLKWGSSSDGSSQYEPMVGFYDPNTGARAQGLEDIQTLTIDASCQNHTLKILASLFDGFSSLKTINNIENLKTEGVTNMNSMFIRCFSLQSLDLSSFNTASVTDMNSMFNCCMALQSLDLSSFNTASVTDMGDMFSQCSSLQSLDLSSFNTASVTDMNHMFYKCSSLQSLDLSSFNTASVTYMGDMFSDCSNLENIYVGDGWSTQAVTNGSYVFNNCPKLPGYDGSKTSHEMAKLTTDGGYLKKPEPVVEESVEDFKWDATTKTGTFKMPESDVIVKVEYKSEATVSMNVTGTGGTAKLMDATFQPLATDAKVKEGERFVLYLNRQDGYDFTTTFSKGGDTKEYMQEFSEEEYKNYINYAKKEGIPVPLNGALMWVTMPDTDDEALTMTTTFKALQTYTVLYKTTGSPTEVWARLGITENDAKVFRAVKMQPDMAMGDGTQVWSLKMQSAFNPEKVGFFTTKEAAEAEGAQTDAATVSQSATNWNNVGSAQYLIIGGEARTVYAAFVTDGSKVRIYNEASATFDGTKAADKQGVSYRIAVCQGNNAGTVRTFIPTAPEGKEFGAWIAVKNQQEEIITDAREIEISENTTFTAIWLPKQLSVSVNTNNGLDKSQSNIQYGQTLTLSEPTRRGFAFNGWAVDKTVTENGKLFGRGAAFDMTTPLTADLGLTAQWKHVHEYVKYQISQFGNALKNYQKYNGIFHIAICNCDDVELVAHEFNPAGKCACGYEKPGSEQVQLDIAYGRMNGTTFQTYMLGFPEFAKRGDEVKIDAPHMWGGNMQFKKWQYSTNGQNWYDLAAFEIVGFLIPRSMQVRAIYESNVTEPQLELQSSNYLETTTHDGQTYKMDNILFQMDYKLPDGYKLIDAGIRMGDNAGISYYEQKERKYSYDGEAKAIAIGMLAVASILNGEPQTADMSASEQYWAERENSVFDELTPAALAKKMYESKPVNVPKYDPIYWEAKAKTKGLTGTIATLPPLRFAQKNNQQHYIYGMAYLRYKDRQGKEQTIYTPAIAATAKNPNGSARRALPTEDEKLDMSTMLAPETQLTVNVDGKYDAQLSDAYGYGEKAVVTAPDVQGKQFSYWTTANGAVFSTSKEVTITMNANTKLNAVYGAEQKGAAPAITSATRNDNGQRIVLHAIATGDVQEAGFVYSTTNANPTVDEEGVTKVTAVSYSSLATNGADKIPASILDANNCWSLQITPAEQEQDAVHHVRAYVKNGNTITYGDVMDVRLASLKNGLMMIANVDAFENGIETAGIEALLTQLREEGKLMAGYAVEVPAGEYATYYNDKVLKVEDTDAQLFTVTAIEDGKAVTEQVKVAAANTPLLVMNNSTETKTFLLLPTEDAADQVAVADEFLGTLTDMTFTEEETKAANYYVCNGKEFIQVRGAGTLAANRAYLKVDGTKTAPASIPFRRSIDGGEGTTGIDNVNDNLNDNEATWYDLGGRKLNGKPAQKGVYIKNGKKVVIK